MKEPQQVYSNDGHRGVIISDSNISRSNPDFVQVRMDDGMILQVPHELLELRPDGNFNLRINVTDVELTTDGTYGAEDSVSGTRRIVVPVIVEELEVDRKTVTTGIVRVHKRVHEREELVDDLVAREEVSVERVPVDAVFETLPTMRSEGDTLIIPVVEEVLVIEKRFRVTEEVHIQWKRSVNSTPQQVILRSEEVVVERETMGNEQLPGNSPVV